MERQLMGGSTEAGTSRSADARMFFGTSLIGAILVSLVLGAGSASALDNGHAFSSEIKPTGAAEFTKSEFCCPQGFGAPNLAGAAVDNSSGPSSGDLYVIDGYGHRIEKFDSEGHFLLMFGDGVDGTTEGDVCTATSGDTCKVGNEVSSAEGLQCPAYIAVDSSAGPSGGDVYVGDTCQRKIHKYDEGGNRLTGWGNEGAVSGGEATFGSILGMVVTASGQLLVRGCQECYGEDHASLIRYGQDGTLQSAVSTPSQDFREGLALSADESSIYYPDAGSANYAVKRAGSTDGSGAVNFSVGAYEPPFNGFKGIAGGLASDSSGTLYAAMDNYESGPGQIWEWQVDGSGQPLDAEGNPCTVALSSGQPGCPPSHEFGSSVLGEFPRTPAVNESSGAIYVPNPSASAVDVFIAGGEATAATEGVTWVATAHGIADPDGAGNIVTCEFQFGPTRSYGSSEACSAAGPLPYSGETAVSAELPGLNGDGRHTYHDRLVVTNAAGAVSFGPDHSFVPTYVKGLQTLTPEGVTRTQATLEGSYEDTGKETEYFFEWGTSECPCPNQSAKREATSTELSAVAGVDGALPNLKPQTVYHYRVVAENELGTTFGADQTFETQPAVESLTTETAEPVERRKATAKGSFQGDGTSTTYSFEWGPTASYGNTLATQSAGSPSTVQHVAMGIDGCLEGQPDPKGCLEPSYSDPANPAPKTYHYRITATDGLGTTVGADREFTTLPAVAGLETKGATSIDQDDVTLNGKFTGNGEDTEYFFEYGLTPSYGMQSEPIDAGQADGSTDVSGEITEYEAYETYHYRIVAKNAYGTTYGNDETFGTEPAPLPEIGATTDSSLTPTEATLEATVNPNRWLTVYAFEYGPTGEYGETTEISQPIGADKAFHPVSERITGLQPGTTYHFRAVAINFTGTRYGSDETLTTPGPPRIYLTSFSGVGQGTSRLSATVSADGGATTAKFEYGTSTAYGQATAPVSIAGDGAEQRIEAALTGLEPGTTYHFRVVASNGFGVTEGPDESFTTEKATPPPPNTEVNCQKGLVKRHGRCVKKPHHKKHHRKHHKKHRRGQTAGGSR